MVAAAATHLVAQRNPFQTPPRLKRYTAETTCLLLSSGVADNAIEPGDMC